MASDAQIGANRLNARKSTGPRTVEGKAVVAQNAVRHGLLAQQAVIRGEDPGQFEFYREQLLGELAPAGAVESMLAERAVGLAWRLRRAERIQAEVFDTMLEQETTDPVRKLARSMRQRGAKDAEDGCDSRDLTLGRVVVRDFGHSRVLDRLGMYERRIEHSLYKTMNELQKLRLLRELDPPVEERTPEPARPAGEERSRETNPISPVSQPQTQVESRDKAHVESGDRYNPLRGTLRLRSGQAAQSPFSTPSMDSSMHVAPVPSLPLRRTADVSTLRSKPEPRLSAR